MVLKIALKLSWLHVMSVESKKYCFQVKPHKYMEGYSLEASFRKWK